MYVLFLPNDQIVLGRAGLENVTLHTLRHTFASQLAMAGVSLMEIQQPMGHRSHETTLQYAHLSEDHVKKQVNRLPFVDSYGKNKAKNGRLWQYGKKKSRIRQSPQTQYWCGIMVVPAVRIELTWTSLPAGF